MKTKYLEILKDMVVRADEPIWNEGLLRKNGSGHTAEVAQLPVVHPGRDSASAFVLGRLTGSLNEADGVAILSAIEELQVSNISDRLFGAFRWYREESEPRDTNAAFFTLLPLVVAMLYEPELLESGETQIIDRILDRARSWFIGECENPILFYTNKIVSDGAMLTAVGKLTADKTIINISREFLKKWLDYTETRGFGWGENLSRGYNGVTVQGFTIIKKSLDDNAEDNEIKKRFDKIEEEILDIFRFHNGYEFVPAIRSYNVLGKLKLPSVMYNLAGVRGFGLSDYFEKDCKIDIVALSDLARAMSIYGDRLYSDDEDYKKYRHSNVKALPAVKETHIMDDVTAYSWLGNNGGLGSLNKFPVTEGSYQHKGWGLGWQCFPVSSIIYKEQVSFLRFVVNDGEKLRCHPHKDKHSAFLDPSLFSESYYPDVRTDCRQNENTLIAIRSINKLRNKAKSICDSFDVQRFRGEVTDHQIKGRQWVTLLFDNAAICISPLLGIPAGQTEARLGKIETIWKNGDVSLVQTLYEEELKTLYDDRIYTGWVIHFIDDNLDKDTVREHLEHINISESHARDGLIPRMPQWNIHAIEIRQNEEKLVSFSHDPYV